MEKIGVVIMARSASERFPRKHLASLGGMPMIQMLISRVMQLDSDKIIVATTRDAVDQALADTCEELGATVVRGHATDLHARWRRVVEETGVDGWVDISGDSPFFDLHIADAVIDAMRANPGHDTYGVKPHYSPVPGAAVNGKAVSWLDKWEPLIADVSVLRREQFWTAVDPPELDVFEFDMPGYVDRTKTPIKLNVDYPLDLALANVVLEVLGRVPDGRRDWEYVWSVVHELRVVR